MGSNGDLLRTLAAGAGVAPATPGVRSSVLKWRRGRDSNPRYGCPYAAFRVRCFQPLSHLSGGENEAKASSRRWRAIACVAYRRSSRSRKAFPAGPRKRRQSASAAIRNPLTLIFSVGDMGRGALALASAIRVSSNAGARPVGKFLMEEREAPRPAGPFNGLTLEWSRGGAKERYQALAARALAGSADWRLPWASSRLAPPLISPSGTTC